MISLLEMENSPHLTLSTEGLWEAATMFEYFSESDIVIPYLFCERQKYDLTNRELHVVKCF